MNLKVLLQSALRRFKNRPIAVGVPTGAIAVLAIGLALKPGKPVQAYSDYEVKRGDFLISVVEGGTLEAVNEIVVRSEVEGTARIIYIVPEGSYVKKGDLLVELDSSSVEDAVNQQQINVEKAQFALVQAEQQLEIQKSVVDSEIAAAKLRVEFAESDLDKFQRGEALQVKRNAQIQITNVMENLKIAEDRLEWSQRLFEKGYETKGNLDRDRLTVNQTTLSLEQVKQAFWMVETFDNPKKQRSLEAALQEARENLDRVKLQDDRRLAQFNADVQSQRKTLELSQTKLERDRAQLQATKLYAPQDGLVVYGGGGGRFSNESMIEEGAVVRNRQEIIKLPDITAMKVQVKIHESHINQVRLGQPAFVVLDSMPDQRFRAVVNRVAPLPDSQSRWGNPDLKVYATEILVRDKLPDLKPGVSARAEIVITNLPDALTVPIQAVTTRGGKQVVFLASAPRDPVPVTVGMYNTKFIEITSGIKDGDKVLLAPPFDTKEKDLGGAIIADGETLPVSATNAVPSLPPARNGENHGQPSLAANGTEAGPAKAVLTAADNGAAPGNGRSDETQQRGRRNRAEGGSQTNRVERLKQFDVNGDGQLDEGERTAMREQFARERSSSGAGSTAN